MTTASGSQPTDGPPDNACEVNLTGADPLVRDSQPDRGAIIRRYLRWRWGSLAKVTDEAREKAEQDYDFWAVALRVVPPEGGPRAELRDYCANIAEGVVQRVADMDDRSSPEDWPEAMLVTGEELLAIVASEIENNPPPALRASGAGTRQEEPKFELQELDPEARRILYANLWNLYGGEPPQ